MPAGQVFADLPAAIRPVLVQGLCFGTKVALCEPLYTPWRRLRAQLSPFRRELPDVAGKGAFQIVRAVVFADILDAGIKLHNLSSPRVYAWLPPITRINRVDGSAAARKCV